MKLTVLDMTCNHCVMKIEKALLMSGVKGKVNLEDHSVTIVKEADVEKAKEAISKAGYHVEG